MFGRSLHPQMRPPFLQRSLSDSWPRVKAVGGIENVVQRTLIGLNGIGNKRREGKRYENRHKVEREGSAAACHHGDPRFKGSGVGVKGATENSARGLTERSVRKRQRHRHWNVRDYATPIEMFGQQPVDRSVARPLRPSLRVCMMGP